MASEYGDPKKIAALPQEGVHCFPAAGKQINTRRVVTVILMVAFIALAILGFVKGSSLLVLGVIAAIAFIITLLVFIQTFLIATYRVAVDYNEKKIVLRYRYSKISIPFENFDARDGEPDRAEALIDNNFNNGEKTAYLVLDNVFEDACFQTSSKDLASKEDFLKLKEEAFAIADAYGARESEDKVKFWNESKDITKNDLDEDDLEKIVADAKAESEGTDNASSEE